MEMDSVIRQLYAQWRIAKDKARQECESRSLPNVAEKYRKCTMFKGTEDVQGVLRLFSTTQGIEFCMGYHFPNLATMRLFKSYIVPERHGIYLDAGGGHYQRPQQGNSHRSNHRYRELLEARPPRGHTDARGESRHQRLGLGGGVRQGGAGLHRDT